MKLGRNDLCHCGSGKKIKKCCLKPETQSPIFFFFFLRAIRTEKLSPEKALLLRFSDQQKALKMINSCSVVSEHNIFDGLREYVLDGLFQLRNHCKLPHRSDDYIKFITADLLKILQDGPDVFVTRLEEKGIQYFFSTAVLNDIMLEARTSFEDDLTQMERFIVRKTLETIIAGYALDSKFDYGATGVLVELAYRAIRDRVHLIEVAEIDVVPGDVLLGWDNGDVKPYSKDYIPVRQVWFPFWKQRKSCPKNLKDFGRWLSLREDTKITIVRYESQGNKIASSINAIGDYWKNICGEMERLRQLKVERRKPNMFLEMTWEDIDKQYQILGILQSNVENGEEKAAHQFRTILFEEEFLNKLSEAISVANRIHIIQEIAGNVDRGIKADIAVDFVTAQAITCQELTQILESLHKQMVVSFAEPWQAFLHRSGVSEFFSPQKLNSPYSLSKGLKEFILADLDQLQQAFLQDRPNLTQIEFYIKELNRIFGFYSPADLPKLQEYYLSEAKEFLELHGINLKTANTMAIAENPFNLEINANSDFWQVVELRAVERAAAAISIKNCSLLLCGNIMITALDEAYHQMLHQVLPEYFV